MASNIPVDTRRTECAVCHEDFKHPKLLPCSHTYCLDCIILIAGSKKQFLCPECRTETQVPERGTQGFPDNRYVEDTIELMKIMPDLCQKHKQHLVLFCDNKDCQVRICSACTNVQHKNHSIIGLGIKAEEVKCTMGEKMNKARDISLLLNRSLTELATAEEKANTKASENLDAIDKFRQTAHEKIQELHNKVQQDTEAHKLEVLKIQKSNLDALRIPKEQIQQVKAQLDGFYSEVEKSVNSLPDSTLISGFGNIEKIFKEIYDQDLTFEVFVEEPRYKPADLSQQLLLANCGVLNKLRVHVEPSKELLQDMNDAVPESREIKRVKGVTAEKIHDIDTKLERCFDMVVTSDGPLVISGKRPDGNYCLKYIQEGKTMYEINTNRIVYGVCCVLADGIEYLVNSRERRIEMRNLANGEVLHRENLEFEAGRICTVEDSGLLVVNRGVTPRTLVKFKVITDGGLELERTINTQLNSIYGLTVLKLRGRSLVIGTNYPSGVVEAIDYQTGEVVWKIEGDFEGKKMKPCGVCHDDVRQLYISDWGGDRVLVASADGTIKQELLNTQYSPESVVFDIKQQQLIVQCHNNSNLTVYNINYDCESF